MKYKVELDENNYLISFTHTDTVEDIYEFDASTMDLRNLNCYKLVGTSFVFDTEKKQRIDNADEIAKEVTDLKEQLADTDYKISKSTEYLFAKFKEVFGVDFDFPYDMELLNQQRQALRDRINELEN